MHFTEKLKLISDALKKNLLNKKRNKKMPTPHFSSSLHAENRFKNKMRKNQSVYCHTALHVIEKYWTWNVILRTLERGVIAGNEMGKRLKKCGKLHDTHIPRTSDSFVTGRASMRWGVIFLILVGEILNFDSCLRLFLFSPMQHWVCKMQIAASIYFKGSHFLKL